jgi:hypothetical protein
MKEDDYYERHFNWYKLALCKIATAGDQANPMHLMQLAQAALDGEPTTADKHNVNFKDRTREENINKSQS